MISLERAILVSFIAIVLFLGVDVYDDLSHGADWQHALSEISALLVSFGMVVFQILRIFQARAIERLDFNSKVRDLTLERDVWRARSEEFLNGLGQAIEEQFQKWGLSPSEKEIGLLILKGFSHKEIAEFRKTSERTVRQQAAAIYAKAGLENKAQLSAFFLEDLALPMEGRGAV